MPVAFAVLTRFLANATSLSTVQASTDPFLANAGNGLFPNGSYITPVPNPSNVYTQWNTSMAKAWLKGLANKPTMVAIDNEIEIASNTHQDMHPM
jgi:phosphatidylinositol glycan class B